MGRLYTFELFIAGSVTIDAHGAQADKLAEKKAGAVTEQIHRALSEQGVQIAVLESTMQRGERGKRVYGQFLAEDADERARTLDGEMTAA